MYTAVCWDNDGVLVDTETDFFLESQRAFTRMGVELKEARWVRDYLGRGIGSHRIALDLGADPGVIAGALEERRRRHQAILSRPQTIRPDVETTLRALAGRVRLALVTSAPATQLELIHRHTNLLPLFDLIITADDCGELKPHPAPYLTALEKLKLPPEQCLAVEDSARGLASALAAGLDCIVVPTPLTRSQDFTGALAVEQSAAAVMKYVNGFGQTGGNKNQCQ